jgi:hypothetical protein
MIMELECVGAHRSTLVARQSALLLLHHRIDPALRNVEQRCEHTKHALDPSTGYRTVCSAIVWLF